MTSCTDLDPVLELELSTGVDGHAFKGLAGLIIRFAAALECMQDGALIYATRGVGR